MSYSGGGDVSSAAAATAIQQQQQYANWYHHQQQAATVSWGNYGYGSTATTLGGYPPTAGGGGTATAYDASYQYTGGTGGGSYSDTYQHMPPPPTTTTPAQMSANYNPTLWIGDLEEYMDEYFLRDAFASLGETLQNVRIIRDKKTGIKCNYGFLQFPDYETAKRVHLKYNNKVVPNSSPPRRFKLNEAQFNKSADGELIPQPQEYSLFIGDLTPDVDDYQLYQVFSVYPSCRGARIVCDQEGNSKGYGFVRFTSETDQQRALIEMQWYKGCGSKSLRVSLATQKTKGGIPIKSSSSYPPPTPTGGTMPVWGQTVAAMTGPPPQPHTDGSVYGAGGSGHASYYMHATPATLLPTHTANVASLNTGPEIVEHGQSSSRVFDIRRENAEYMNQSEGLYESMCESGWVNTHAGLYTTTHTHRHII